MEKTNDKPCKHILCPDSGPCRRPTPKKNRTPLKRSTKPINPVSKKQAKRLRTYRKQKQTRFKDDNICAVALLENKSKEVIEFFKECQFHATQQHHPAGRIGKNLFDEGIKLCGICHGIIERMPDLAKSLGLSRSRLTNQ